MSLIDGVIPRQGFEIIRDKICAILLDELNAQYLMTYDEDLNLGEIFMERFVPFDYTELPALNVGLERGDYENQHQGHADGNYRFWIECNTKAPGDDNNLGDTKSKVRVQKLLGKVRAILENPVYKTLGFATGLIRHRHIESFVFAEPTRYDMENVTMSRVVLVVRAIETNQLLEGAEMLLSSTTVKLGTTDKGYYWEIAGEGETFDETFDGSFPRIGDEL